MNDRYYVVRYTGPFGFIKPWTAVRDAETYSQQFLTPSIVEGMRRKLETGPILRHRLSYLGLSRQTEETQAHTEGSLKKDRHLWKRGMILEGPKLANGGILSRYVLIEPLLHLAFAAREDAESAARQHVCLCRNEDVLLPEGGPAEVSAAEFEELDGFELLPGKTDGAFLVGYNRFAEETGAPSEMWGRIVMSGRAIREE